MKTCLRLLLVVVMLVGIRGSAIAQIDAKPDSTSYFYISPSEITVDINQTVPLRIVSNMVLPAIYTPVWKTSNYKIAYVRQDGTISGISSGEAVIEVTYGPLSAKCLVKVNSKLFSRVFRIIPQTPFIKPGDSLRLSIETNADLSMLSSLPMFRSSNPAVAEIVGQFGPPHTQNANGLFVYSGAMLVGKAFGKTTVTGQYGGFVDSTQVFVESVTANFPYVIEPKIVTMNVGEKVQLKLTPTRDLTNEKLPAFKWMSFDDKVATVDQNGVVTANSMGALLVYYGGAKGVATCLVKVTGEPTQYFKIDPQMPVLKVGQEIMFGAFTNVVLNTFAPGSPMVLKSSNPNVADFVENTTNTQIISPNYVQGKMLKTKAIGRTTITAYYGGFADSTIVEVQGVPVDTGKVFWIEPKNATIKVGERLQMKYTLLAKINAPVKWFLKLNDGASIDSMGVLVATKPTHLVVVAYCAGFSDMASIDVVDSVTQVSDFRVEPQRLDMQVGEVAFLKVLPLNSNVKPDVAMVAEDAAIADVDNTGKVVAKMVGKTNIVVWNNTFKTSIPLVVTAGGVTDSVKNEIRTLMVGERLPLKSLITDPNAQFVVQSNGAFSIGLDNWIYGLASGTGFIQVVNQYGLNPMTVQINVRTLNDQPVAVISKVRMPDRRTMIISFLQPLVVKSNEALRNLIQVSLNIPDSTEVVALSKSVVIPEIQSAVLSPDGLSLTLEFNREFADNEVIVISLYDKGVYTEKTNSVVNFDFKAEVAKVLDIQKNTITDAVAVYPNPTNGMVSITYAQGISLVDVYSIAGTLLMAKKGDNNSTVQLSVSDLAADMVILVVKGADGKVSKLQLVIKK